MFSFFFIVLALFFFILALINLSVSWWIRSLISNRSQRTRRGSWADNFKDPNTASQSSLKAMVQCAYCQVYLPKEHAISGNGEYFCCQDHFDKHKK